MKFKAMEKINLINEISLNRLFTKHLKDGFIIITTDKSFIDDPNIANKRFAELKKEIATSGYSYIPIWGLYKKINTETGNIHDEALFEQGILVSNQKVGAHRIPYETDQLPELGKRLAAKYHQESFLYKPQGEEKKAYWIDLNGAVDYEFSNVTVNDLVQEFFTKLNKAKDNAKLDRRFTFTNEIYFNQAPDSLSEAYCRYGEQYFRV